jgi:hypothetical protein
MRTLVCLFDYSVHCTSMHSHMCMVAPHLGTLAEAREGPDVEPNPKTVFGGSIPKIEGSGKC